MKISKTKLSVLLARQGLTQKGLATKLGVGGGTISQYLIHNARPATLAKIAKALDVGIEDIVVAEGV